jgi:hypothetical protein
MVSNNGTLYFLGNNNAYSFNPYTGPVPTPFSLKVQPWISSDPFVTGFPMNGVRGNFFAFIYYDRYHICYSSANPPYYDTILAYDTNIQGWTVLTLGVPVTCQTLVNAPNDPNPTVSLMGSIGGRVFTWDPYVGQTDSLWNDCSWNSAVWDDTTTNSDNGTIINVWVSTKFFKTGEPGSVKTLHRIYPEIVYALNFNGTATVQTDYNVEAVFTSTAAEQIQFGSLWDQSIWDSAIWNPSPQPRASWNAPQSRIDVTSQVPGYLYNFLQWNLNNWNQLLWGSNPLPTTQAPGIQGEAFSIGMQTGIGVIGGIWDQSLWDQAEWSANNQLPWILSGFTGSFSQGGKR